MNTATLPVNEKLRLDDLHSYNILDTPGEPAFDELVELASAVSGCPIAMITFLDKDRQWVKAKKGIDICETNRDLSFCSHTISQNNIFSVHDTLENPRFSGNPLFTQELGVRFYTGIPIVSPQGFNIGALCVMDTKPGELSPRQNELLLILAKQASRLVETKTLEEKQKKQAQETISLKIRSFRKLIDSHEKNFSAISHNLHEDIAQTIASSIFYLRMLKPETEAGNKYLTIANRQLLKALDEIRKVSYEISPPGFKILNVSELVNDLLSRVSDNLKFKLEFSHSDNLELIGSEITILLVRTLSEWIQVLSEKSDATLVKVFLEVDKNVHLFITDNGISFTREDRYKEIMNRAIYDKIQAFEGNITPVYENDTYTFRINLPLSNSPSDQDIMPSLF